MKPIAYKAIGPKLHLFVWGLMSTVIMFGVIATLLVGSA